MYSTRDKILLALDKAPAHSLSGAALASRLGMTRASVWKHIKALRADGYPIQTRKATGYRLSSPFDFSLLKEAGRSLPGWKIHYAFSTSTTQALAKYAAEHGSPEGHLWVVEKQTAGRGRLDRIWESPLGGLWMSVLLRPRIAPSQVPALTLVTALALLDAVHKETGLPIRLKWPNDLVVETSKGWQKIAGLLTEMSAEVERTKWVVLGLGLNVNNTLPRSLASRATTLTQMTDRLVPRARILKLFLSGFAKYYRTFESSGFEAFRSSYWRHYSRPDQPVALKTAQGLVRGVARGVDARGALQVESLHQMKSIWEGEIV